MRKKFIYIIIIVILFCTVQNVCAASGYNYISIRYDNNVAADCIKPNRVLEISVNDFREYNDEILYVAQYDKNDALVALDSVEAKVSKKLQIKPDESVEKVRAFLWSPSIQPVYAQNELEKISAENLPKGSGTHEDPYRITTPDELKYMFVENHQVYKLMNDIDLSNETWYPKAFLGVLDGGGRSILGLSVDQNSEYSGLISILGDSYFSACSIKNLNIEIKNSAQNAKYSGAVAGYMWFPAQIINCNISGTIVSNTDESYIGGVSGYTYGGEIQNCNVNMSLLAMKGETVCVGGIFGGAFPWVNNHYTIIKDSNTKGTIAYYFPKNKVGGICGDVVDTIIENCTDDMSLINNY